MTTAALKNSKLLLDRMALENEGDMKQYDIYFSYFLCNALTVFRFPFESSFPRLVVELRVVPCGFRLKGIYLHGRAATFALQTVDFLLGFFT